MVQLPIQGKLGGWVDGGGGEGVGVKENNFMLLCATWSDAFAVTGF